MRDEAEARGAFLEDCVLELIAPGSSFSPAGSRSSRGSPPALLASQARIDLSSSSLGELHGDMPNSAGSLEHDIT